MSYALYCTCTISLVTRPHLVLGTRLMYNVHFVHTCTVHVHVYNSIEVALTYMYHILLWIKQLAIFRVKKLQFFFMA